MQVGNISVGSVYTGGVGSALTVATAGILNVNSLVDNATGGVITVIGSTINLPVNGAITASDTGSSLRMATGNLNMGNGSVISVGTVDIEQDPGYCSS